ncbi:MAG: hypothetical protein JNK89_01225 [Saprospiraceae bacterium]|nr:hypothetical protein [Saprospiraceae bacterium]
MLARIHSILLLVLFALAGLPAQTETDQQTLLRDLDTYRRVTMQLDYDSLLGFMPPKMLDMIPAEQLKVQLQQAFDNDELYITLDSMRYGAVPPAQKAGDFLCALVPYSGQMEMHFKENRDAAFLEIMVPLLNQQFGEGVTQIAGQDSSLYLKIALPSKNLIAFKGAGFDSWKFIEDKRSPDTPDGGREMMMLNMFVPEAVLAATKPNPSPEKK